MRQIQMNASRLLSFLSAAVLMGAAAFAGTSCQREDPNAERDEYIRVYGSADIDEEASTSVVVGVRAGTYPLYLRTNVPFEKLQFEWQDDGTSPWASVGEVVPGDEAGLYVINLKVKARSSYAYYTRRTGMLMISVPELNLGTYVKVNQGCTARFSNNCANFKYGVAHPLFTAGERIYSGWSTTQKAYFSTEPSSDGVSYLYGRNGNLRLGDDEGHGACLITPFTDALRADSLLMVSFRAAAFADDMQRDDNKLRVEILGGGIFRDDPSAEQRVMEIEVPNFDSSDPDFPASMWNDGEFMLFIQSSDRYPVTANTRIRFSAGSLDAPSETNSRIYMSNFYIRRLVEGVDEDYFAENGGSGVDRILGLVSTTETD